MLKVLLIGYGVLGESLLSGILTSKHQVVGLLSWDRRKTTTRISNTFFPDNIEKLRRKYKIKAIDVEDVNSFEFIKIAKSLDPDILLIGSWGQILKKHVIDIPNKYCINCHPSYLPKHRGSNPYSSSIIAGESFTGVTFHEVDENIDTGRIILQEKIPISENNTGESIRTKCGEVAKNLIVKLLDDIENNNITLTPQDESIASYYPRLKAEDGAVKWGRSAQEIHNQIRGLHPWIYSYATYKNKLLLIETSHIVNKGFSETEPGTIIEITDDGIIVSTKTPGKALFLGGLQIFGVNKLLSKMLLNKEITVGERLKDAL